MFAQLPGFSFGFGPASAYRSPQGVCSSLTQDGVKGAAASGALAHSGRGEGRVRRRRGEPGAAEAGVTLQQPEARRAFFRGSCPWFTGPWQWRAAAAPGRGGVESDLCSHTGFLVVAAAALASHARLWSSFKRRSESPLLTHQETRSKKKSLISSAAPDFFPDSLPASCGALTPSGCVHAANASPLPGIHRHRSLSSHPPPAPEGEQTSLSGW